MMKFNYLWMIRKILEQTIICVINFNLAILSVREVQCSVTVVAYHRDASCTDCLTLTFNLTVTALGKHSDLLAWLQTCRWHGWRKEVTILARYNIPLIYNATIEVDSVRSSLYNSREVLSTAGHRRVALCLTVGRGAHFCFNVSLDDDTQFADSQSECLIFPLVFIPVNGEICLVKCSHLQDNNHSRENQSENIINFAIVDEPKDGFKVWTPWINAGVIVVVAGVVVAIVGTLMCRWSDQKNQRPGYRGFRWDPANRRRQPLLLLNSLRPFRQVWQRRKPKLEIDVASSGSGGNSLNKKINRENRKSSTSSGKHNLDTNEHLTVESKSVRFSGNSSGETQRTITSKSVKFSANSSGEDKGTIISRSVRFSTPSSSDECGTIISNPKPLSKVHSTSTTFRSISDFLSVSASRGSTHSVATVDTEYGSLS